MARRWPETQLLHRDGAPGGLWARGKVQGAQSEMVNSMTTTVRALASRNSDSEQVEAAGLRRGSDVDGAVVRLQRKIGKMVRRER